MMTDAQASDPIRITVTDAVHHERIDRVLERATPYSRSQIARWIKDNRVSINGETITKPSVKVVTGDQLVLQPDTPSNALILEAENIPLSILFEDDDCLIVNKPAGMVVHPAPGHTTGTLVHALLHHAPMIRDIGEQDRPGIVHRLDRDTSGGMIVAKSKRAFAILQQAFQQQHVKREYLALAVHTHGNGLQDAGTIESYHGRAPGDRRRFTGSQGDRVAITHYRVLERYPNGAMLVHCTLQTGRTHQIRMHLREQGAPILGDALYGGRAVGTSPLIARTALHATCVGVELPWMPNHEWHVPPPDDFAQAAQNLAIGVHWRG